MATNTTDTVEQERAAYLQDAQDKAVALFEEIGRDLIRPGISEKQLSDEIHELGQKRHNVRTHWHKRVVGVRRTRCFLTRKILQTASLRPTTFSSWT